MAPTATVSGLFFAHPESNYFQIGSIDKEQVDDYAARRGLIEMEIRKMLGRNFNQM
jgi:5-methyltetrahydrofolate--homocysteine methyltransferase